MGFLPLKQRVNRDKKGFATKQRMFGLLIIDEGPLLSMTDGRAVAHFKLVWQSKKFVGSMIWNGAFYILE